MRVQWVHSERTAYSATLSVYSVQCKILPLSMSVLCTVYSATLSCYPLILPHYLSLGNIPLYKQFDTAGVSSSQCYTWSYIVTQCYAWSYSVALWETLPYPRVHQHNYILSHTQALQYIPPRSLGVWPLLTNQTSPAPPVPAILSISSLLPLPASKPHC